MLLKKLSNSFAYRSGPLYQKILSFLPVENGKNKKINPDWVMVTMCGSLHLEMLKQSLSSLMKSWTELPLIKIYSDGNTDAETIKKKLADFKEFIQIDDWSSCLNELNDPKYADLKSFAQLHNIGKKLAVIAANAIHGQTLWWDCDILWFKPFSVKDLLISNSFFLKTTEDYQPAYADNMVAVIPEILDKKFINTGIVLMFGEIPFDDKTNELFQLAATLPNHFSEQTILAYLTKKINSQPWPLSDIACHQGDQLSIKPTFPGQNWTARHYVGPVRHLFWRDAFYLRFK